MRDNIHKRSINKLRGRKIVFAEAISRDGEENQLSGDDCLEQKYKKNRFGLRGKIKAPVGDDFRFE